MEQEGNMGVLVGIGLNGPRGIDDITWIGDPALCDLDKRNLLEWRKKMIAEWNSSAPDLHKQLEVIRKWLQEGMRLWSPVHDGPLHPDLLELATREFAWLWIAWCEDHSQQFPTEAMIQEEEELQQWWEEYEARQREGVPPPLLWRLDRAKEKLAGDHRTEQLADEYRAAVSAIDLWKASRQTLPIINAGIQDLPTLSRLAWKAIQQANQPPWLFNFNGLLSRLEQEINSLRLMVVELTLDRLRYEVARMAKFVNYVKAKGAQKEKKVQVDAKPPTDLIRDQLATPNPPLPLLRGIVDVPVFTKDGVLLNKPGYDPASGLYLNLRNISIPPISLTPSLQDLARAKALLLNEVFGEFPFVGESDRAHAVALSLLPFIRELIPGPTPNHVVEGASPGIGKDLLVEVGLGISHPDGIPLTSQATSEEEWRKRITALLCSGATVMFVDNLTTPLDSGTVAACLTAPVWTDRLLGRSEMMTIPMTCLWVMTGNNPVLSLELVRRSIRIRLDPKCQRPWLREGFRHPNLHQWAKAHQGELIWACLVLIQSWIAAGKPIFHGKGLGKFEQWSQVMGGILDHAGIKGFLGNLLEFYQDADQESGAWEGFLATWWATLESGPVPIGHLVELLPSLDEPVIDPQQQTGSIRVKLGKALTKRRGLVINGLRITQAGKRKGAILWKLERVVEGSTQ
jgi:hypothetical protein